MIPLKRYDGHRSHVNGKRIKRLLQKIDKEMEFKRWEKNHEIPNQIKMGCQGII